MTISCDPSAETTPSRRWMLLMRWAPCVALVLLAGCAAPPPAVTLETVAEGYVRVALQLAQHDPTLVEVWRGPESWRPGPRVPVAPLLQRITSLRQELAQVPGSDAVERRDYLAGQLKAAGRVQHVRGRGPGRIRLRRLAAERRRGRDEPRGPCSRAPRHGPARDPLCGVQEAPGRARPTGRSPDASRPQRLSDRDPGLGTAGRRISGAGLCGQLTVGWLRAVPRRASHANHGQPARCHGRIKGTPPRLPRRLPRSSLAVHADR